MTKQNIITWAILMVLTVSAGLGSRTSITYVAPIIILIAAIKFIAVAFNFMEMKKANSFWKVLIIGYLIAFSTATLVLL